MDENKNAENVTVTVSPDSGNGGETVTEDKRTVSNYAEKPEVPPEKAPDGKDILQNSAERHVPEAQREKRSLSNTVEKVISHGAGNIYADWIGQGERLKAEYPSFDMAREFSDPEFVSLLKAGLDVKRTYYALRHDAIQSEAVKEAARNAELRAVNEIKMQSFRPSENANAGSSPTSFRRDVRGMSSSEIREILRRVGKGEKVEL